MRCTPQRMLYLDSSREHSGLNPVGNRLGVGSHLPYSSISAPFVSNAVVLVLLECTNHPSSITKYLNPFAFKVEEEKTWKQRLGD